MRSRECKPGAIRPLRSLAGALILLLMAACGGGTRSGDTPPPTATPPVITQQPAAQTVWSPAPATFQVQATGTQPLTFQWIRNGVDIPGGNLSTYSTGPTSVTDHQAAFSVRVSNSAGSATSSTVILNVNQLPFITQQPDDVVTVEGQTVSFQVKAQGTPVLQYQWKRNGTAIAGATAATLTLPSVTRADNLALFSAVVANGLGSLETRQAQLQVGAQQTPPVISLQPLGGTASIGQSFTIQVSATGTPPLRYQWRKNAVSIPGATQASLSFTNIQATDAGAYSVVVSNDAGSVTSADAVIVIELTLPTFTTQPVDTWVGTGSPATFFAAAAGSPPMQYQWLKNGAELPGATQPSYTTAAAVIGDHGTRYRVRATNPAGSTLSQEAVLNVFEARTVEGTAGTYWQTESGASYVPLNLVGVPVEVLQQEGTGGFARFPGTGLADGSFRIPGVPPGPYLVVIGPGQGMPLTGQWMVQGTPDFRTTSQGRTERILAESDQSGLAVNVQGPLRGLTQGLSVLIPSLGVERSEIGLGPIYRYPWKGTPLTTSAQDSLWTLSFATATLPQGELTIVSSAGSQSAPNMSPFGETMVNATPTLVPATPAPAIAVNLSAYADQLVHVNPALNPVTNRGPLKIHFGAQPGGGPLGPVPPWAPIYSLSRSATANLPSTSFASGDPYPAGWTRAFRVMQEFTVSLPVPGTSSTVLVSDAFEEFWLAPQLPSGSLAPLIRPVVQPKINGGSFSPASAVGATPLLTWQLQVPDVPSYQKVTVFQVQVAEGKLEVKAEYLTTITSQRITPGVLEAGKHYLFRIQNVWGGTHDPQRPFLPSWPFAIAPVYSGIVTP